MDELMAGEAPGHRRVLMLCYYYPPIQTVAISRSVGFARELPRHGWSPLVLTVADARDTWSINGREAPVPAGVAVERAPEIDLHRPSELLDAVVNKSLRRLGSRRVRFFFRDLCVPDPQRGWRVRGRGAELARGCDCIYVSCSPFSSALAGISIKRRSGRPLVLDFRDPWTLNPHGPPHMILHRWLARRMERACVRAADRVIVNTEGTLARYREHYPRWADRFVCIPNGFDTLNVPDEPRPEDAPFTVMHVGMFYGRRDPSLVLEALVSLGLPCARFVQVGPGHRAFDRFRDRLDIRVTGQVTHARASEWMRSASLLYLSLGREPGFPESIAVTAKTYEYLATGLPILADCPPGDNARMVERFAANPYVITTPDREAMAAALRDAFEQRAGRAPSVHPEFVETFSRGALAARLAAQLDAVSGPMKTPSPTVPGPATEVPTREASDAQ